MDTGKFPTLGTETVLKAFPDLQTGPVLKAFPELEVGKVFKIHRDDLADLPSEGDRLNLVILSPLPTSAGLRIDTVPDDPALLDDAVAEAPDAIGALSITVLETSGWAVVCTVTDIREAADE
jgi:hypothetical protein